MENIQNMQGEKSRKKLLAPLVVLLLCAVSLTGAAYAYTSSMTSIDNNVHVEGLTLSLTEQNEQSEAVPVAHALYDFKIAYSGHTQTGKSADTLKAIRYSLTSENSVGFRTSGSDVIYDENVTAVEMADLSAYADGSYVDTQYAVGNGSFSSAVGYRTFDFGTSGPTKDQLDAGLGEGIYKIGKEYTLNATNHSDKEVTLTLNVKYSAANPDFGEGVKGIYIVVSGNIPAVVGGSAAVSVSEVVRIDNSDSQLITRNLCTMGADQGIDGTNLKIQAYLVCSDFYSSAAFGVDEDDIDFVVNFTAKTA